MKTSAERNLKKLKSWGACPLMHIFTVNFELFFFVLKHSDLYILFSTEFLTEDGLFDMIRSSKPVKKSLPEKTNKSTEKVSAQPKISPQKDETRGMNCTAIEHAFWVSVAYVY